MVFIKKYFYKITVLLNIHLISIYWKIDLLNNNHMKLFYNIF